ncbi:serine hydrolase [Streptococcus hongkongensis]|nr:beta-lactamase [Streptococcus uberis]
MKKILAVFVMLFFMSPIPIISTEKQLHLSKEKIYQLDQSVATKVTYFDTIPQNPNVFSEENSYKDSNLTQFAKFIEPNEDFSITNLQINENGKPVFQLSDGNYIEANKQLIYDDTLINQKDISQEFWTQVGITLYDQPYVKGVQASKTTIDSYKKVHASRISQTQQGIYYYIDNKGWASANELSISDNRMIKVQEMLSEKYNKENYSIFVKQLNSQASAGINADKQMYSASIAKLGTLYFIQERIKKGQLSPDTPFKYTDEVNHFKGDYDPSGSGKISKEADNKEYSVDNLLRAVSQHSDNVATNILGYYGADKYDVTFTNQMLALSGLPWDMEKRNLSSRQAARVMEAIYYQNGKIISYMSHTDFDDKRISKNISVPVAHKIGDAYDYKHDVAIVYADSPFILSIFTDKSSYDDLSKIADDVYSILK